MLIQFDRTDNTLNLAKFPYTDGTYGHPSVMHTAIGSRLLSTNDRLFVGLSLADTTAALLGMRQEAEQSAIGHYDDVFAFVAVDDIDLVFRVVFCGANETEFRCQSLFLKDLYESWQAVGGMDSAVNSVQVQNGKIFVVLPSKIFEFEMANLKNNTSYGYSKSMQFVQYFNNNWYGISSGNKLFVLEHDDTPARTLQEIYYYRSQKDQIYEELSATNTYLLARYKDLDGNAGFSIFHFMENDFFNESLKANTPKNENISQSISNVKSGQIESDDKQNLFYLDYSYQDAHQLVHLYEWKGYLLIFGMPGALIMSLPPSVNPPAGKSLMYQTVGTFNQTFVFETSGLLYLLPVNDDISNCAAITSKMLIADSHLSDTAESHLFINSVESASPVLNFEKLTDEELEGLSSVKIDLYYKDHADSYLKRSSTIHFENLRSRRLWWLWIALTSIGVLFLASLALCIVKSWKAIKKGNSYSIVDNKIAANHPYSDEPFINNRIPDRLTPYRQDRNE